MILLKGRRKIAREKWNRVVFSDSKIRRIFAFRDFVSLLFFLAQLDSFVSDELRAFEKPSIAIRVRWIWRFQTIREPLSRIRQLPLSSIFFFLSINIHTTESIKKLHAKDWSEAGSLGGIAKKILPNQFRSIFKSEGKFAEEILIAFYQKFHRETQWLESEKADAQLMGRRALHFGASCQSPFFGLIERAKWKFTVQSGKREKQRGK